jgi:fumarate hydratase class II
MVEMNGTDPREADPDVSAPGQEMLYGEQTRLALANFGISGLRVPRALVRTLGLIKACAARVNRDLRILPADLAQAVEEAAMDVAEGLYDDQFPVDVFQTGSGTSTNMNAKEVIAALAGRRLGRGVPCTPMTLSTADKAATMSFPPPSM